MNNINKRNKFSNSKKIQNKTRRKSLRFIIVKKLIISLNRVK